MNDVREVTQILIEKGIKPVKNPWSDHSQVWLTNSYVAVEVESKDLSDTLEFFSESFKVVRATDLSNGNVLVKAESVKDSIKEEFIN